MLKSRNNVLRLRILLYSLVFSVYAWFFNPFPTQVVDEPIRPYLNEYIALGNELCPSKIKEHSSYTIQIEPLDKEIAGVCSKLYFRFNISFNSLYWNKYSEDDKFQVLAHEASHCFFGIQHSDNPRDYMYYTMNNISKSVAIQQIRRDMIKYCGSK